jgi:hypothetical protein
METGLHRAGFDPQILRAARCERDFACLDGNCPCETQRFTNRDIDVVRCLGTLPCGRRTGYDGMQICLCPVQRKVHGL